MNNANGQGGSTFGWLRKEALLFVNKKKQKNFFMLGLGWWRLGCLLADFHEF